MQHTASLVPRLPPRALSPSIFASARGGSLGTRLACCTCIILVLYVATCTVPRKVHKWQVNQTNLLTHPTYLVFLHKVKYIPGLRSIVWFPVHVGEQFKTTFLLPVTVSNKEYLLCITLAVQHTRPQLSPIHYYHHINIPCTYFMDVPNTAYNSGSNHTTNTTYSTTKGHAVRYTKLIVLHVHS